MSWMNNHALTVGRLATAEPTFWFPEQASTFGTDVDFTFHFILYISYFFFALVVALMVYFAYRYRYRDGVHPGRAVDHSLKLEMSWTILPTLLSAVMFVLGFRGFIDMRTPPKDTFDVQVTGRKWAWSFQYPNGASSDVLHVPVNRKVKLVMTSDDVIHSFYVPAFRIKQDVVPGRYTTQWFETTTTGQFQVYCTEYCGTKHSDMLAKVVVHSADDFQKWTEDSADVFKGKTLAQAGEVLMKANACFGCHSVDGAKLVGPTFKGLYGRQEELANGDKVQVDEDYLRESIVNPMAKVVAGYPPAMPTFQGRFKEKELTAIIEYLKTVN
jgi:cytochrome c oxidase subunit 2